MVGDGSQGSLAQRTALALCEALQAERGGAAGGGDSRGVRLSELLIEGIDDRRLPETLDPTRLRSPDCAAALAVNTFLPWQHAVGALPLAGWVGFEAIQFEVRCPTGLRGTPPHLDLLALRENTAVAVTVRCTEYLGRRKSAMAPSYDRLLASTPGLDPWRQQLERLRASPERYRHVDLGALLKYTLALGRTFPDRSTTLLYLFWEPLDAARFEAFRRHRQELAEVEAAAEGARILFFAQPFEALWRDWATRSSPAWLAQHVARLRMRYNVAIGEPSGL